MISSYSLFAHETHKCFLISRVAPLPHRAQTRAPLIGDRLAFDTPAWDEIHAVAFSWRGSADRHSSAEDPLVPPAAAVGVVVGRAGVFGGSRGRPMLADAASMTPNHSEEWRLEAHCCEVCFGRIASKTMPDLDGVASATRSYRCLECGIERAGHSPAIICACGFKVKGRTNLGLRCETNIEKTRDFPAEIIARQAAVCYSRGRHLHGTVDDS